MAHTGRWDAQTDRQADRQTDTDTETDSQTGRHTKHQDALEMTLNMCTFGKPALVPSVPLT